MSKEKELEQKIKELEKQLAEKSREMDEYKHDLLDIDKDLRSILGQVNEDLKSVRQLQHQLVPVELPRIPDFEISSKFVASLISGGDYFDIFELSDKMKFGILLSSASGHGMSALVLSILLKMTSQFHQSRSNLSPLEMAKIMVDAMSEQMRPNDTVDFFYGVVNRRTFELTYIQLGDVSCFHYETEKDVLTDLVSNTPSIHEKFDSQSLKEHSMSLNPNDFIILCSKGISQAKNKAGEIFGKERIKDIIVQNKKNTVHDVRNEILFQIKKYTGKTNPDRDVTVLVAEVKDKVLRLAKENP